MFLFQPPAILKSMLTNSLVVIQVLQSFELQLLTNPPQFLLLFIIVNPITYLEMMTLQLKLILNYKLIFYDQMKNLNP